MIRKGLRPRIRVAFDRPPAMGGFRRVLPFRRSWFAIALVAVFDLIFLIPAIITFREAANAWSGFNDLFDLVAALFLSAWLLGWSFAPLALTLVLLLMLFGREVISVAPGRLKLFLGLPGVGAAAEYDVAKMRNLRIETPLPKSSRSWRGEHIAFDYGANTVRLGSDIDAAEFDAIRRAVESGSGITIRQGDATPEELAETWKTPGPAKIQTAFESQTAPTINSEPVTLSSASTLALIAANLVPLLGTAYFGWKLSDVMVLYWAESAVIGVFNVCKIIVVGRWLALLAAPFFISHFGAFMAVHFLFLYGFFIQGPGDWSGGDLVDVMRVFTELWPALAVLFASHALSFFMNFLGRNEYRDRTMENLMSEPYSRIIFMHLVLIIGGGLTLILGESTPVLLLAIAVKIWIDVRAHLAQREAKRPAE
ncbi:MAG: DUF6498-containing protein [Woeseiaceae bacterium]